MLPILQTTISTNQHHLTPQHLSSSTLTSTKLSPAKQTFPSTTAQASDLMSNSPKLTIEVFASPWQLLCPACLDATKKLPIQQGHDEEQHLPKAEAVACRLRCA
jgi:hypothetical protein